LVDRLERGDGGRVPPDEVASSVISDLADEYRGGLPIIEGAVSAVRRLAAETAVGLVSGSPLTLIKLVLELTSLTDSFRVAMSSDDVARGKPAPDPYLGLAHRLGVSPASCVAVEDSANGIRSACSAGMAVIAIPRGEHRPASEVLECRPSTTSPS
jgi:HAD superfamily hydrolase (TIGR01509 family)